MAADSGMGFLRYLRLKCIVSFLRLLTRFNRGLLQASPDEVLQVPSRDRKRTIKVHLYSAKPAERMQNAQEPRPVLINLHGSGFVLPLHGSDDEFCRLVSRKTDYTVLDMQYRLAPEHPFPAALNDAEDVIKWVLAHPSRFDQTRIALGGFSAGASLVLAAASSVFPKDTFRSLLAFYPTCDLSTPPGLKKAPDASGRPISVFMARTFNQSYIPASVDARDPRISPLFAPAENFPKNLLVITCAYDNLAPEAEALAAKVEADKGHHVILHRMEKCDHAWDKGKDQGKKKDEAYALALEMLGR